MGYTCAMPSPKQRVDAALRKGQRAQRSAEAQDDAEAFEEALVKAEENVKGFVAEIRTPHRSLANREKDRREKARATRAANEAKGIPYIHTSDGKWRRACKGTNLYNEQCGCIPIKAGKVLSIDGFEETCTATGGWCILHDPAITDTYVKEWRSRARGGRKRFVGPDEYIREMVNSAVGIFIRPHLDAIGAAIDHDTGEVKRVNGAGAKIFGESKDGDIYFTTVDDVEAQQKAAERLFDRGFGRPRVQTELSITPMGGSANVPPTAERARDVALVLAEAGAIQTDTEETDE